jgi:CDP-4-dehydro-6-deoxyglucose reductase, E1
VTEAHILRQQILALVGDYAREAHGRRPFRPGRDPVHYGGRVFDADELIELVSASLDFWLTAGPQATRLERGLAHYVGTERCMLVNSGSSANLVAFAALTARELGDRRIQPGDEVITVAAAFPTTVAPIVQHGAVPVFVDIDAATANVDVSMLEAALSPRTKAVVLAHALGNPFDIDAVGAFCRRHGLWLLEDNCDALGATYDSGDGTGRDHGRRTGSFGHLATSSFYPSHQMTTGEGGAVYTDDAVLAAVVESLRDWGRDCWCAAGKDNTCGKRFSWCFDRLPPGYDHKYVYARLGYNLKITDLQAAVGLAQLRKLPEFVAARRRHHAVLAAALAPYADRVQVIQATPRSDPSWFGLLMLLTERSGIDRRDFVARLERAKVQTRLLFAGNLLRQPCADEFGPRGIGHRVVGSLPVTDAFMARALWVGVHPGMGEDQLGYVADTLASAVAGRPVAAPYGGGRTIADALLAGRV